MLIDNIEQLVLYEGLQRFCFSCGRIGHRKEECCYSVREALPLKIADINGHEVVSQKGGGSQMVDSHVVHEVGPREDMYGPWMVVTRRRNGTKKDSRSNPTTMQTKSGTSGTSTSSAEGKKHDKLPAGPSNVSNSKGKRKASVA
nr:hypothetical protein CFP56_48016 [Quercus suber]